MIWASFYVNGPTSHTHVQEMVMLDREPISAIISHRCQNSHSIYQCYMFCLLQYHHTASFGFDNSQKKIEFDKSFDKTIVTVRKGTSLLL
jgi:hypothetical protein